jgi:hypothetical protein
MLQQGQDPAQLDPVTQDQYLWLNHLNSSSLLGWADEPPQEAESTTH